jgi:hypothetical protein
MHRATHRRWGGPPHGDAPEADAGVFVAAPAMMRVAAASLAPRPYAGGLRANAIPMLERAHVRHAVIEQGWGPCHDQRTFLRYGLSSLLIIAAGRDNVQYHEDGISAEHS